jgi:CRISPR-associated protein (TIGR03986 family)
MKIPKHVDPIEGQESIAPYNFVPLPDRIYEYEEGKTGASLHGRYDLDRHTGWIDLKIETLTPLYIRCAYDPKLAGKKVIDEEGMQEFYHHGDPNMPFIPGSSLRGMVRSLVKIMAYAKSHGVGDRKPIFREVGRLTSLGIHYRDTIMGGDQGNADSMKFEYPSRNVKGGYLQKTRKGWAIVPAKEFYGESFVHVSYSKVPWITPGTHSFTDLYVEPGTRGWSDRGRRGRKVLHLNLALAQRASRTMDSGLVKACLVVSGDMNGKHWHCAIFEPDQEAQLIPISSEMWNLYEKEREAKKGINPRPLGNHGDPLFYLVDSSGHLAFFGPTMMMRLPYRFGSIDYVPQELINPYGSDLVESIFGRVGKDQEGISNSTKGRVCFEDARYKTSFIGASPFLDGLDNGRRSPRILSSPKPSSYQHYLVQTDKRQANRHYSSKPGTESVIRGDKLYWHKTDIKDQDERVFEPDLKKDDDTQHTIIRPVRRNVEFRSRVHFENLSSIELGALMTALELRSGLRHRLGMGKPLGMGSVKITPDLHLSDRNQHYSTFAGVDEKGHDVTEDTRQGAMSEFQKAIKGHMGVPLDSDFWKIPRVKTLATLLDWDHAPRYSKTRYIGIQDDTNGDQWKVRKILPTPEATFFNPDGGARSSQKATHDERSPDQTKADKEIQVLPPKPEPKYKVGDRVKITVTSYDGEMAVLAPEDGIPVSLRIRYFQAKAGDVIKMKITEVDKTGNRIKNLSR